LSNRYLDLLHRHAPPETILATTFTRKAAGEILERILRRLALAATDARQAKELADGLNDPAITAKRAKEMLVAVCRSLHRVSVSTIDSFFSRIANTFRHELRIPPNPQVVDDDDALAARVRAEAIEAMLGDDDTQVLVDLLRRLHHDTAARGVTEAIDEIVAGLYDTFRQTRAEHWNQLTTGDPLNREDLAAAIAQFDRIVANAPDKNFAKAIQKARACAERGLWEDFLSGGLCGAIVANPTSPTYYKKPLTADQQAVFTPLILHARAALLNRLAAQTVATYDLLARFDEHYTRLRDQRRLLLFSDLPHKLARELPRRGEDLLTEICFRLDASVQHLLLDEFQDTSFDQWSILRPFAEEVTSVSDATRTFFCVGDIKQAIYGWRGGRAEIFDRIERDLPLPDDAQVAMAQSFRSSQVVLDAVNRLFTGLGTSAAWKPDCPHQGVATEWSARFEPHTAARDHAGYVEIITSSDGSAIGDDDCDDDDGEVIGEADEKALPRSHEDFVARRIAQIAASVGGRSIGVLVATNRSATSLIDCLQRLNVNASAEGRTPIVGDPAVDVVLAALKIVDHPGDTAAAFHVLNSPLAPILGLRSIDCNDVARVAQAVRFDLFARGYADVIAEWTRRLAPSCEARSALRLTQLVELADKFAAAGGAAGAGGMVRTRTFIEAVRAAQVEEPSQAQVRVMTIHKAKGLEFDVVVLPELRKCVGTIRGGTAVYVDRDDTTDEVRAVFRGTNKETRALSPQLQAAYEQEQVRRLRDDLCALYVAMTRPRHALHIVLEPVKQTKRGAIAAAGCTDQSYAAIVRVGFPIDAAMDDVKGGKVLWCAGEARWYEKKEARSAEAQAVRGAREDVVAGGKKRGVVDGEPGKKARESRRTWRQVAPSSLHGEGRVRVADLLDLGGDESRRRGTLIHAWCSAVEWLGGPAGEALSDAALLEHARSQAALADADPAWMAQQIAALRQMLTRPGVVAALSRPALANGDTVELWRERPFAVRIGGDLLRGSFDRVMIVRRGGRVVVSASLLDFKTDRLGTGPASAASLTAHYRPQLAAYRAALAAMLGVDGRHIETALLFLATGELCPV